MATAYVYRCPTTGLRVQGFGEPDQAVPDGRVLYVAVECAACRQFHLVNPQTGRLASEGED